MLKTSCPHAEAQPSLMFTRRFCAGLSQMLVSTQAQPQVLDSICLRGLTQLLQHCQAAPKQSCCSWPCSSLQKAARGTQHCA